MNIHETAIVYDGAKVSSSAKIGPYAIVYPNAVIDDNTVIGPYCIIGEPVYSYYKEDEHVFSETYIGKNCILRSNAIIYEGVQIKDNVQTGHHVTIRENTKIGKNCSIGTLTDIQKECELNEFVRVHSGVFMGEFTKIDSYAWIMPHVILTNDKYPPMDNLKPVTVNKSAVLAAGSLVLPGVNVGEDSLIAAGAVVSKDVADETIVVGVPAKEKGSVTDIRDESGEPIYPWKLYLKENRGYPWQK